MLNIYFPVITSNFLYCFKIKSFRYDWESLSNNPECGTVTENSKNISQFFGRTRESKKKSAFWDGTGNPNKLSRCLGMGKPCIPVGKYSGRGIPPHTCFHFFYYCIKIKQKVMPLTKIA